MRKYSDSWFDTITLCARLVEPLLSCERMLQFTCEAKASAKTNLFI